LDHLHALQTNAAERYLLGELPADEAEDFELHYFECQQCALSVETGELFIAGLRAHGDEPGTQKPASQVRRPGPGFLESVAAFWHRPWFAFPVMAALAVVAIYQNAVEIPGLRRVLYTARALPAVQLIGVSRGEEPVLNIPQGSPFAELKADVPPGEPFKQYACVLTRNGREVSETPSPAPADGQPVTIQVPVAQLEPGHEDLTLFGLTPDGKRSDKISTYPFTVQIN
jgi:hypothetical protein